jgi:hypothetical protein
MKRESVRANEEVLCRIQGEFMEMPGLQLTEAQARRLWGLNAEVCSVVLNALIDARFLSLTASGAFVRSESSGR